MRSSAAQKAVVFFVCVLMCSFQTKSSATFFGEAPTGLQNIASDRYGYSIFVPENYTPNRSWPLVMALHDTGQRGEEYVQSWVKSAKERGVIVFCPTYEEPRSGLPFDHDERLLRLVKEVQNQYDIDHSRILVTGYGNGGHYALYLALRYPQEFSAAASIGNGLTGYLEKLFSYSFAEVNRLPILILAGKEDQIEKSAKAVERLQELKDRSYEVEVVESENQEDLKNPNTLSYILQWFFKVSAERESGIQERSFSMKQGFYEWVDSIFQNR